MDKNISLSDDEKQIIFGGLLGDSYYNFKNKSITFLHSEKQLEYLIWKNSFFKNKPHIYKRCVYLKYYDKNYLQYSFRLYKNNIYTILSDIEKYLYKNDAQNNYVKKISLKYLKKINPLGLAIWWMDDGCLSIHKGNRYGKLSTHCFNYEENILIKKYFHDTYHIDVDIKKEKNKYYFIRFNVQNLQKFIVLIYQYVCQVKSMIYKIDLDYKNNVNLNKYVDNFEDIYYYIKSQYNNKEL